jgi:hypothetical protein
MEKDIRFFKQDNKWYADIPNHTLEENEMVMGADIALDYIANGEDEVFITVTDEYPGWNSPLSFHRREHDNEGAFYDVDGLLFTEFLEATGHMFTGFKPEIWICNVTHDVFGEHPEDIYIYSIE